MGQNIKQADFHRTINILSTTNPTYILLLYITSTLAHSIYNI